MREKSGLTLVEILTVLAIIALLIGILIPAVSVVKTAARNVKQTAQFTTIELALTAFNADYGDYPPSHGGTIGVPGGGVYFGSQKLAEALLGWDLVGFHPDSAWRRDGKDTAGGEWTYDPPDASGTRVRGTDTFDERIGPYLEAGTQYAFKPSDLYNSLPFARTTPGMDRYVICDVFQNRIPLADGTVINAGSPILYYKADPSGTYNNAALLPAMGYEDNQGNIYNYLDNTELIMVKEQVEDPGTATPFDAVAFYDSIADPKITAMLPDTRPYNPNSYILISAGADGDFGTDDDVRSFGN